MVLLLRLLLFFFGRRSAQPNSDSLQRICIQKLLTQGVLFSFAFTPYTTQCSSHVHSLSIIDHAFGVRLNTLRHDYSWCLYRHPIASRSLARYCTHLCSRLTALRTTSAYFLNCETVCGDMLRMYGVLANIFFCQQQLLFLCVCGHRFLMTSWICQKEPFWIPVSDISEGLS